MKKRTLTILAKIFIATIFLTFTIACQASDKVKIDPKLTAGRLENGLSYFIYPNNKPHSQVSIRLAIKTGSIHEADDQQGIAHFVEHMAFNGSTNFPNNELIDFLEMTGVEYGPELNAYTSFDATVYMLEVPLTDPKNIETAFTVLRDWGDGLLLKETEIDKERGIILQERRDRLNAWARFQNEYIALLFQGSIYSQRFPIGTPEIIKTISYDRLRQFYYDWYTPDRMAIIVSGEIDPKEIEERIRSTFDSMKKEDEPKTLDSTIPDTETTDFLIFTDPELEERGLWMLNRIPNFKGKEIDKIANDLLLTTASSIINLRLDTTLNDGTEGIASSFAQMVPFVSERTFFLTGIDLKIDGINNAISSWATELEQLRQSGAKEVEIQQTKETLIQSLNLMEQEKDSRNSIQIVKSLVENFIDDQPTLDRSWYKNYATQLLEELTTQEINQAISQLLEEKNRVCLLFAPETDKEILPTEDELTEILATVESAQELQNDEIMADLEWIPSKKGEITSTKKLEELDSEILTLSNGATVLLRPSDLTQNNFNFVAWSEGGTSLAEDAIFPSAELADDLAAYTGLANLDRTEKRQWMSRKGVFASVSINELEETIVGGGSVQEMEEGFKLLAALFSPITASQEDFEKIQSDLTSYLENQGKDPQTYFGKELNEILRKKGERDPSLTPELVASARLEIALTFYKERFADASDFIFVFTGAFSSKEIKKLLRKYIATLPSDNNTENGEEFIPRYSKYPQEDSSQVFRRGMEEQALIYYVYHNDQEWDASLNRQIDAASDCLDRVFDKEIREKESGTYSISAFGRISRAPYEERMGGIVFSCDPSRLAELEKKSDAVLQTFLKGDFDPQLLENYKKIQLANLEKDKQKDSWWSAVLLQIARGNLTIEEFTTSQEEIESLEKADIVNVANLFFKDSFRTRAVLLPQE